MTSSGSPSKELVGEMVQSVRNKAATTPAGVDDEVSPAGTTYRPTRRLLAMPSSSHGGWSRFAIVGFLVALLAVSEIVYHGFLTWTNLRNLVGQNSSLGLIAVGMTFVIISEGFDLSVGGMEALSGVLYAGFALHHGVLVGLIVALVAGIVGGVVNAGIIVVLKVNPFITTLGMASVFSGLAYLYSKSAPITVSSPSFSAIGTDSIFGIPWTVVILTVVMVVGGCVLKWTTFGRNTYAIGGNEMATRLSGVHTGLVRGASYVLTGLLAALGGIILASQIGVGQADIGASTALTSIAMVVVGGTSLSGGEGGMWRTLVGFLTLAALANLFNSVNINSNWELLTEGAILIGAVAIDMKGRRGSRRQSRAILKRIADIRSS